jgi:hypothetical protein
VAGRKFFSWDPDFQGGPGAAWPDPESAKNLACGDLRYPSRRGACRKVGAYISPLARNAHNHDPNEPRADCWFITEGVEQNWFGSDGLDDLVKWFEDNIK